jgi:hypothetical protein
LVFSLENDHPTKNCAFLINKEDSIDFYYSSQMYSFFQLLKTENALMRLHESIVILRWKVSRLERERERERGKTQTTFLFLISIDTEGEQLIHQLETLPEVYHPFFNFDE